MIFASFGNSPVPFPRMAAALDKYAEDSGENVIVQSGKTEYPFKHCVVFPFMDKRTFISYLKSCDVAVLQGGWGSISEASDMKVRMVIIPRINGCEHHHDQEQLVRALEADGILLGCYDTKELAPLIEKAKKYDYKPIRRGDASTLINDFITKI